MTHSNWTNREQKEALLRMMEENPEVAKGFSTNRIDADRFWKDAADKLNSYGPPSKDGATWKKVWADYKSKTKKKLVENEKKRQQTGHNDNNLVVLSEFEQAVSRITCLSQSVTGINARIYGIAQAVRSEAATVPRLGPSPLMPSSSRDISMTSYADENVDPVGVAEGQEEQSTPLQKRSKKDTPTEILMRQNEAQEVFFAAMSSKLDDISNELHRLNRHLQKADDRQRKSNEEKRRHNLAVENLMREKLELKKRLLEAQIEEIGLKLAADC